MGNAEEGNTEGVVGGWICGGYGTPHFCCEWHKRWSSVRTTAAPPTDVSKSTIPPPLPTPSRTSLQAPSLSPALQEALMALVPHPPLLSCSSVWGGKFLKGVSVFVVGGLGEALSNARAAILSDQVAKAGGLNCTAECPRR